MKRFGRGDKDDDREDRSEVADREREKRKLGRELRKSVLREESDRKRSKATKSSGGKKRGSAKQVAKARGAKRPVATKSVAGGRAATAKAAGAFGTALKRGASETRGRSKGVPTRLAHRLLAIAGAVYAIFFDVVAFVLNLLIAVVARLAVPIRWVALRVRRGTTVASRMLTPARVLTVVVAGAAILLALSQFADYRGISIGTEAYSDEVAAVAPAPERERSETGSAHGYAMVPVAIIALVLLGAAVAGRRPQLCRFIALAGIAAVAVSLIVDRPAGLDPGETAVVYEGVRAMLLGGFYAQLFAGLLLAVSATLLGRELRRAEAPSRVQAQPRRSRRRKGTLRRAPKAEGAGA